MGRCSLNVASGYFRRGVAADFSGVAETARAQLDVLVAFAIGAERAVVVHAAGHVCPVAGPTLRVRDFLEVEDVKGCGRGSVITLVAAGTLCAAAISGQGRFASMRGGDSAKRGDVGARG